MPVACVRCATELPPDARFCLRCGSAVEAEATAARQGTDGERRQLTVLFCDLVGSTELSARLDPEELRELMRHYQVVAARAVERHGGHVAQYLGDGVLAYFGYPQAHEDDAERAVRAGLALVAAVPTLDTAHPLTVRIGIHTGLVVVGPIGGGGRHETLALGETPNLAARLQALAEPGMVLVSLATLRLVRGIFVTEALGARSLRGIPERVEVHRMVQPSGVRSRLDLAAGQLTPLIGREPELAALLDRWERARARQGQAVLLVGEAGMGKSRLLYELRQRLADQAHTWLECRCSAWTQDTPLRPVIELLEQGLALRPEDREGDKHDRLTRGLEAVGLTAPEALPLMSALLGLSEAKAGPLAEMSPELQRRRTLELLARWNLALGELQPVVCLVEDVQWADPTTVELLGRLIEQGRPARMLLVCTARPEFVPPWSLGENVATLQLARLTPRQTRGLVTSLGAAGLSAEVVDALVARADGVPLYAEELVKTALELGVARSAETIPATLQDSLLARLDRLSAAKEVAQRAAALGREFPYRLLAAVAGIDEAALRQGLSRLVSAQILFVQGEPPTATYTFKHALLQELAYESVLKRTRQELHARVVRALLTEFPARARAEPEVVARHAEAAGLVRQAVTHYQGAGEQAQARSAHEEAIAHLRKAINLLTSGPRDATSEGDELSVQLALAPSLIAIRGYAHPETEAAWERARRLAEIAKDLPKVTQALGGLLTLSLSSANLDRATILAERVLEIGRQTGDEGDLITAYTYLGAASHYQGHFATSLEHCDRATQYRQSEYRVRAFRFGADLVTTAHGHAAWNLWYMGFPGRARQRARECVDLARTLGHPFSLALAMHWQAFLHWLLRDTVSLRAIADGAIVLSETQGFPLWLGLERALHGAALVALGSDAALAEVSDGLALAAGTGNQLGAPGLLAVLIEALATAGRNADALGTVEMALGLSAQTNQPFFDAELHRLKGELLATQGNGATDSEVLFLRALEIARSQRAVSLELRAATSLARHWQRNNRRAEAQALLAAIYAEFTEGFDTPDLIEARTLLNELR